MLTAHRSNKIEIRDLKDSSFNSSDSQEVLTGLTNIPKSLPPKYFYDRTGSELFEKICLLPEYYPTRTETAILTSAGEEIAEITGVCELVELGSGSSTKTRLLLSAYEKLGKPWQYVPIDVSSDILKTSALQLHQEYPLLSILGLVGTYEQALTQLPPSSLTQRMIIFLGSTLGNFTQEECDRTFTQIRETLEIGDYFLLGIDLQKSPEILEAAYNDSQGITAQFNLNMLAHLNRLFDGNFDLNLFQHQAIYNQDNHQIEMYLIAKKNHEVRLNQLELEIKFEEGEKILTEISRKFSLDSIENILKNHSLKTLKHWTDKNDWFGLILAQVI